VGKGNKVICLELGDPVVLNIVLSTFRRNVMPLSLGSSSHSSVQLIENWRTQIHILQLVLASRVLLCIRGDPVFKCSAEALAVLNEVYVVFLNCSRQMLKYRHSTTKCKLML